MGYFARLNSTAQSGEGLSAPAPHRPETEPVPTQPAIQTAAGPAADLAADPAGQPAPVPAADPAAERTHQEEELASTVVALESEADDDAARRKAHEAAEAKRKAEWEARQQAKRTAAQAELDRIAAMSDEEVIAASTRRIGMDTEKLTRRNMKEAVCEHIQAMCRQDPAFARRAVQPGKSMIHCFKYINRRAQEYAEQEMKDNGVERSGVYGLDVPDGLCFQWAVDYFNDPDAKEDKGAEESFTPRPYVSKATSKPKKEPAKKAPAKSQPQSDVDGQLSFMEAAG